MTTDTLDRLPREFVRGRRANLRVVVHRDGAGDAPASSDLDALIEHLRCDAFDLYATIREAQRESSLLAAAREAILADASAQARLIADAIDRHRATPVFDLEPTAFGVPI
jgi:hypothetical protein